MPDLPILVTTAGYQPLTAEALRALLVAKVTAINPDITMDLAGTLIEDITSTDVGALLICDSAVTELINSLTPLGANAFILAQLGQQAGILQGLQSNTSVELVFSGTPGFVIDQGFLVSDGTYQYSVPDGGIIKADGTTDPLFALATQTGSWGVPAGTVTQIVSSVPTGFALAVVNQEPGVPGTGAETESSYRARVLQGGQAVSIGMTTMLRTLLSNVPGVQLRLISAQLQVGGGWLVLVGGGDNYAVANAIFNSVGDISTLIGSKQQIIDITNANPGVVSLDINHGFSIGQAFAIAGTTPTDYDDTYAALAIPAPNQIALGKSFAANLLTALSWASTAGGQITATTTTAHGVTVGSSFVLSGCVPTAYNGTYVAIAGTSGSTLVAAKASDPGSETTLGTLVAGIAKVNTTSTTPWASGGIVTPNFRNIVATVIDYPDSYPIPFAVPPQQTVTIALTWNTISPNPVSDAAIAQAGTPALVDYVNSIVVGKPMNLFELQFTFQAAIANILDPKFLSRMVFDVAIDGVGVDPESGTGIIEGDTQSFLFAVATGISITRG